MVMPALRACLNSGHATPRACAPRRTGRKASVHPEPAVDAKSVGIALERDGVRRVRLHLDRVGTCFFRCIDDPIRGFNAAVVVGRHFRNYIGRIIGPDGTPINAHRQIRAYGFHAPASPNPVTCFEAETNHRMMRTVFESLFALSIFHAKTEPAMERQRPFVERSRLTANPAKPNPPKCMIQSRRTDDLASSFAAHPGPHRTPNPLRQRQSLR